MLPSLNGSEGFVVSRRFEISDASQVGEVRRHLTRIAQDLQFSTERAGEVAIVVNELANNLLQHAGRGEIIAREICSGGHDEPYSIEIISIDRGPGMTDPEACLQDGYSTGNTPGQGLGAIQRLSDEFDLYSAPEKGTVVSSVLFGIRNLPKAELTWSVICIPLASETACGDAWAVSHPVTGETLVVADGLGHGPLASVASHEATKIFREHKWRSLEDYFRLAHEGLKSTRGASVSAVVFDRIANEISFAGVGNVSGMHIRSGVMKTLLNYPGTIGLRLNTCREFINSWLPGDLLILHSDGLSTKWNLAQYPGLSRRSPGVIAGVIYRDFSRGTDDSCIWVGKARVDV